MTNIAVHLAAAVLAFLVALRLLRLAGAARASGVALAVAGLFALHPLQSQAVSYIAERSEALASALYLLALLLLTEAERPGRAARSWAAYAGRLAAFAMALGTKAIAVTLPAAWLLAARVVPGEEGRSELARPLWRLAMAVPVLALDLAYTRAALGGLAGQRSAGFDMPALDPRS